MYTVRVTSGGILPLRGGRAPSNSWGANLILTFATSNFEVQANACHKHSCNLQSSDEINVLHAVGFVSNQYRVAWILLRDINILRKVARKPRLAASERCRWPLGTFALCAFGYLAVGSLVRKHCFGTTWVPGYSRSPSFSLAVPRWSREATSSLALPQHTRAEDGPFASRNHSSPPTLYKSQ